MARSNAKSDTKIDKLLESLEEESEDSQEQRDLEFFIDDIGPGVSRVEVYRMKRDGTRSYIESVTMDVLRETPLDFIRDSYGDGKFLLTFKGADRKIKRSKVVNIDPKTTVNGSTPAHMPDKPASQQHEEFMREQNARNHEMMLAIIAAQKPAPPMDVGAMMTGIAAMMAALKQPTADPSAMLKAVVEMSAVMRGPKQDEDWLDRAKTIIGLAKDLSPNSDREENMWTVIKDVGKEVVTRLQIPTFTGGGTPPEALTVHAAEQHYIPPPNPQPVNGGKPMTTPQQPPPGAPQPSFEQWVKIGLAYLKDKAGRGKEMELCLDWILDNQEEPQFAAIVEAIRKGATFDHLLAFDADIAQNPVLQNWFHGLYDALHAELFKPVDTGGTGGDPHHVDNDEGPSPTGPVQPANSGPSGGTGSSTGS